MRTPEQIEELLDKLELFYNEYDTANKNFERDQKKKHWSDKFSEKLSPFADKLKALNGDDFDIMVASMDEYDNDYSDMKDDDYVNSLVQNIESTLSKLSAALSPVEEKEEDSTSDALCKVVDKLSEEDTVEPEHADSAATVVISEDNNKDDFIKELEDYKKSHPRG